MANLGMIIEAYPELPWLRSRIVFACQWGSYAMGLHDSTSDEDLRAIVVPPAGIHSIPEKRDIKVIPLRIFAGNALRGDWESNEYLWVLPKFRLWNGQMGDILATNRDEFLSKRIVEQFIHHSPYGFEDAIRGRTPGNSHYRQLYGYDTKAAAHCVRRLRILSEALVTGEINVYRQDVEELRAIRHGAWTPTQFRDWWHNTVHELRITAASTHKLREQPREDVINDLCTGIELIIEDMCLDEPF